MRNNKDTIILLFNVAKNPLEKKLHVLNTTTQRRNLLTPQQLQSLALQETS